MRLLTNQLVSCFSSKPVSSMISSFSSSVGYGSVIVEKIGQNPKSPSQIHTGSIVSCAPTPNMTTHMCNSRSMCSGLSIQFFKYCTAYCPNAVLALGWYRPGMLLPPPLFFFDFFWLDDG